MIHPKTGWPPSDDEVTAPIRWLAEDVLVLSYDSEGKSCRVELHLVRVGEQLQGTLRLGREGLPNWVRSSITLVPDGEE